MYNLFLILLTIIFIDQKHFIIPDELNFTLIFLAIILFFMEEPQRPVVGP